MGLASLLHDGTGGMSEGFIKNPKEIVVLFPLSQFPLASYEKSK